jgi:Right handed beta helix region
MSGTARTINFLQTQQAQDGQAVGSYTLSRQRDFMQTMALRTGTTYGTFVRVTDPEFGADPTGTADSTTAFQNAMAAGVALVPALQPDGVTRAIYTVNNCLVPNGASLIGGSGLSSVGTGGVMPIDIATVSRPTIRCTGSAARIFNVGSTVLCKFEGLSLDGSSSTTANSADGISAGSAFLTIRDCRLSNFRNGLGGATGTGSPATTFPSSSWETRIYNCNFGNCLQGINELVDCHIVGCAVGGCQNGIMLTGNSSANMISASRFEWNGRTGPNPTPGGAGYGINMNGSGRTNIDCCQFDSNGNAGLLLTGFSEWITISGCWLRNNGNNVTVPPSGTTLIAASAHIQMNNAYNVVITGCVTDLQNNGTGLFSPAATINFAGDNEAITIVGNDLSGCQGSTVGASKVGPVSGATWKTGTAPTATGAFGYILKNNLGTGTAAADVDTR